MANLICFNNAFYDNIRNIENIRKRTWNPHGKPNENLNISNISHIFRKSRIFACFTRINRIHHKSNNIITRAILVANLDDIGAKHGR